MKRMPKERLPALPSSRKWGENERESLHVNIIQLLGDSGGSDGRGCLFVFCFFSGLKSPNLNPLSKNHQALVTMALYYIEKNKGVAASDTNMAGFLLSTANLSLCPLSSKDQGGNKNDTKQFVF